MESPSTVEPEFSLSDRKWYVAIIALVAINVVHVSQFVAELKQGDCQTKD